MVACLSVPTIARRVGRTGRAGDKDGQAHSLLLTPVDAKFAVDLMESFALGGQVIVWTHVIGVGGR